MKLFGGTVSCFGGSAVKLVAPSTLEEYCDVQSAADSRPAGYSGSAAQNRRRKSVLASSSHWKPALSSISEDGGFSASAVEKIGGRGVANTPACEPSVFTRLRFKFRKSDRREKTPSYWKENIPMALPAFAPAPFLF